MIDQRPRILAIDDAPANLQTLGAALACDFNVQIATSGATGLALAAQSPPDVILLDVMMPGMDGYETCRRLKADPRLRSIPVVFVTALTESDAESAGLALGAADYITKPINVQIARQRIRNLIEREALRKEVEAHRDHLQELVQARTEALTIAKEAAEASNRAKSSFLGNMSHEMRTPMHAIMGMTDLVLRRGVDEKSTEWMGKLKVASQHLLDIIEATLDIARLESDRLTLEPTDFRLADVFAHLRTLFGPEAEHKGLAFELDAPPQLLATPVRGDAMRLEQILQNLIGNALKFTAQGRVGVRALALDEDAERMLIRFEVQDTGEGIAAENQQRMFRSFEQADGSLTRSHGGVGLGLPICKRLAQLMGGDAGVNSEPGEGSLFWFTARLARGAALG